MTDQLAEPDLIAIAQDTWLIGDQALPIQQRSIDAAQINQCQGIFTPTDRGVNPGNPFFLRPKRRQVESDLVGGAWIGPAQDRFIRWSQNNWFGGIPNVEDDRSIPAKTSRTPGIPAQRVGALILEFLG